jgi:hypothetical protein
MEQTKTHLFECKGVTQLVILLCDQWDSRAFQQNHMGFIHACHRAGVCFVFLLLGPDGRTLTPVKIDLA